MKKLITIALLILLIIIFIFIGKNDSKNNKSVEPISFNDLGIRGANKQQSRFEWEFNRLKNPQSGNIPRNIRQKELEFAKSRFQKYSINYRNLNWIHRGPYNVGGRTRGAAIDVTNDNVILSGAVSGGLWRTTDGGENWNKITTADQLHSVSCLVQDKRNGKTNIWYYGTGEGSGNSASAPGAFYAGNGMYKSIDGGLTWNLLAETSSGNLSFDALWDVIWNIAIDNSNNTSDIVYAATLGAIYKSSDGGDSWNKQLGGSTSAFAYYTNVITTPKGVVYAVLSDDGPDNGIWRSQDGETWYNILPDSFPEGFERIVIAINPQNENSIYFLAHTPENGKLGLGYKGTEDWNSLWKYTFVKNNGLGNDGVWQNLSENIPAKAKKGFDDFNAQGSYNLVIKFKPNDSNILFIGGTNLYRSTDGFTSSNNTKQIGGYGVGTKRPNWAVYENHHPDQHEIDFLASDPDVLINFNDGGVFKTNDCMADTVKWTSLNNGYLTTQLYTVNFEKEATNDILIAGFQDNGNYFVNSDNEKASWTMPLNGDGSYSAIAPDREFYIFSTQLGKMAKMTLDNNGNRTAFARIDPIGGKNYQFINPFVIDPNDKNILYLPAGTQLWRNDSISNIPLIGNYDSISSGWFHFSDSVDMPNRVITAIAVSETNPKHRVYYGTNTKYLYKVENANTGDPEHKRLAAFGLSNGNVSCISIDPRNADKVIVVYSNYGIVSIVYSQDGGTHWKKVAGNLEENSDGSGNGPSVRWISILPINGKTLYFAATSIGLFATDTLHGEQTTWYPVASDIIGNVVVEKVKTRQKDGLLVVATHGNGIYSTHVNSVQEVLGMQKFKAGKKAKVFPNPCENNFVIQLPESKNFIFKLISLNGTVVMQKEFFGDNYQFNTKDLQSGLYFYSITSEKLNYTGKLIKK